MTSPRKKYSIIMGVFIRGMATRPEGPQAMDITPISMTKAPPKPAPRPAVTKGLPMGRVTP